MKKFVLLFFVCIFLSACGAEETFETISDEFILDAVSPVREMKLTLPEEAVVPVSQTDTGALYHCDGYELMLQTLPGGDLDATIQDLTGFRREDTALVQTAPGDYKRYDLVWTSMGENGEQVGRAAILDDGNYHYVLSVFAGAEDAGECSGTWEELFSAFSLG